MFWNKKDKHSDIEQAITTIFPRLWRYCLILTASSDCADDLAQSTCLRALQKSHQFIRETSAESWIFRIAKNMWFNEVRANTVRRGGGLQAIDDIEYPDDLQNPELMTVTKDIISGVLTLPEAQRHVVALVYIEGYSYKEASEIMGVPIGTVMSRLATARHHLSVRFKHYKSEAL
jgi:RNA polymerase sigma-70 factor (ECF subfamily)